MLQPSYSEALGRGAGIVPVLLILFALLGVALLNGYENRQPVPTETLVGTVIAITPIVERHCAMTFRNTQGQRTFRLETPECQSVSVGDTVTMYREQYRHDMKGQWREWDLRK